MLSSMLSKFFFGAPKEKEEESVDNEQILERTSIREENGDWLLISCESSGNNNSRVNSECDLDSVCSDSSWVITPAPTFRRSAGHTYPNETANPLEDLLIEHPTMSVYRQNSQNHENENTADMEAERTTPNTDEQWNQNRKLVLHQNRQRQQLAAYLQIPLTRNVLGTPSKSSQATKHPKVTRKAIKRHNGASRLGIKRQVQKCGFKAGRRRC